jgi:biopolymer transport protein ExbD
MLKKIVFCTLTFVLLAGLAVAHGDPILGTVTAVAADTVTIKDKDNKPVIIMLEKTTKYLLNNKPATKTDLKVGVRVSIDAHMDTKMKMYNAEEISIGAAAAAKPATPAAPAAPAKK